MMKLKNKKEHGFTIVELLIATVVFSIVLLIILSAILQISRLFYKGVSMNTAQQNARTVIQDVTDDLRFSSGGVVWASSSQFCIGTHRYLLQTGQQAGSSPSIYGLRRETLGSSGCPTPLQLAGSKQEDLLDNGVQLNALALTCGSFGSCNLHIHLVFYGGGPPNSYFYSPSSSSPAYQAADAECTGPIQSSQFCATADYESTLLQGI